MLTSRGVVRTVSGRGRFGAIPFPLLSGVPWGRALRRSVRLRPVRARLGPCWHRRGCPLRFPAGGPMASIHLTSEQRQDLLDQYRRSADPAVRHRAHVLLLLDAGHPWATIGAVLFCSTSTISRWQRRF